MSDLVEVGEGLAAGIKGTRHPLVELIRRTPKDSPEEAENPLRHLHPIRPPRAAVKKGRLERQRELEVASGCPIRELVHGRLQPPGARAVEALTHSTTELAVDFSLVRHDVKERERAEGRQAKEPCRLPNTAVVGEQWQAEAPSHDEALRPGGEG